MRIMAIDFGTKRTGIAVTDPLQIIATGLTTVETQNIMTFLKDYFSKEQVELVIIGEPKNLDDSDTHATVYVREFIRRLKKIFPTMPVTTVDERFTSKMAYSHSRTAANYCPFPSCFSVGIVLPLPLTRTRPVVAA